jgi:hypothetical protein
MASYDGPEFLMTSSTIYPISSMGGPLAKRVPRSGRWGTVFAVFRQSCYLESGGGQVFCLADQGLGEGPLTLAVKIPSKTTFLSLGINERCHLDTDGVDLVVGHELVLTTAETVIWEPDPVGQTAPQDEILRRLDVLIDQVDPLIPSDGLAEIIPHTAGIANAGSSGIVNINAVAELAMPRLSRLCGGLTRSASEAIDQSVAGLVGLGPGLTPSGDDLLGGMLVALRAMQNTASLFSVDALAGCVTKHAVAETTRISAAMLEQSARGYGSAAQHRLLRCLLGVDDSSDTVNAALDLIRTGHTSGWDALAGILMGIYCGLRIGRYQASPDPAAQSSIAFSRRMAGTPA